MAWITHSEWSYQKKHLTWSNTSIWAFCSMCRNENIVHLKGWYLNPFETATIHQWTSSAQIEQFLAAILLMGHQVYEAIGTVTHTQVAEEAIEWGEQTAGPLKQLQAWCCLCPRPAHLLCEHLTWSVSSSPGLWEPPREPSCRCSLEGGSRLLHTAASPAVNIDIHRPAAVKGKQQQQQECWRKISPFLRVRFLVWI